LLARQHQQLSVGGQYFPHRVLEFPSGSHPAADVLDPGAGNVLDMLLATHHEGEGPDGMAWALGAVAVGLAAAEVGKRKRAGQQIVGKVETTHQFKLALAKSRGLGASGFVWVNHLIVCIP